jgi:hypothetical protein
MNLKPVYTIQEFQKEFRVGHSSYYKLRAMGLGPVETELPGIKKRVITGENAAKWLESASQNQEARAQG